MLDIPRLNKRKFKELQAEVYSQLWQGFSRYINAEKLTKILLLKFELEDVVRKRVFRVLEAKGYKMLMRTYYFANMLHQRCSQAKYWYKQQFESKILHVIC